MRTSRRLLAPMSIAFALVGCNAILDNRPGRLDDERSAALPASPDEDAAAAADPSPSPKTNEDDAGRTIDGAQPDGSEPCAVGLHMCNGVCDPGFADCNASVVDGCEADLSMPATCGACNVTCGAAAPFCSAAVGGAFACTNGCPPLAPVACAAQCVDPQTSTAHCGACGVACPEAPNATAACVAGACSLVCRPGFHACAGACSADTDPAACGPGCVVCPTPPNAAPICATGACGFVCGVGFGDCDGDPATGCEATLASDPLNCGVCGKVCGGRKSLCVNGLCEAPPEP